MRRLIERVIREEDGMELLEWSIVAVLFALAGAASMAALSQGLTLPINRIINLLTTGVASD